MFLREAASLGSPVDRGRVDPQHVGDGPARISLDLNGQVGDPLARPGNGRPPAALLQGCRVTAGGRTNAGNEVREGAAPGRRRAGLLEVPAHRLDEVGTAEDPLISQEGLAPTPERGNGDPAPVTAPEPAVLPISGFRRILNKPTTDEVQTAALYPSRALPCLLEHLRALDGARAAQGMDLSAASRIHRFSMSVNMCNSGRRPRRPGTPGGPAHSLARSGGGWSSSAARGARRCPGGRCARSRDTDRGPGDSGRPLRGPGSGAALRGAAIASVALLLFAPLFATLYAWTALPSEHWNVLGLTSLVLVGSALAVSWLVAAISAAASITRIPSVF